MKKFIFSLNSVSSTGSVYGNIKVKVHVDTEQDSSVTETYFRFSIRKTQGWNF